MPKFRRIFRIRPRRNVRGPHSHPTGYPQLPTGYPQGPRSLHFRGKRPIPRLPELASSSARPLARPLSATYGEEPHGKRGERQGRRVGLGDRDRRLDDLPCERCLGCSSENLRLGLFQHTYATHPAISVIETSCYESSNGKFGTCKRAGMH